LRERQSHNRTRHRSTRQSRVLTGVSRHVP
jgi:hypothetical protein